MRIKLRGRDARDVGSPADVGADNSYDLSEYTDVDGAWYGRLLARAIVQAYGVHVRPDDFTKVVTFDLRRVTPHITEKYRDAVLSYAAEEYQRAAAGEMPTYEIPGRSKPAGVHRSNAR